MLLERLLHDTGQLREGCPPVGEEEVTARLLVGLRKRPLACSQTARLVTAVVSVAETAPT